MKKVLLRCICELVRSVTKLSVRVVAEELHETFVVEEVSVESIMPLQDRRFLA